MKHVVKMRNNVYNKIPSVVNLLIAAAITCSSSPFWPMHIFFFFGQFYLFIYFWLCCVFIAAQAFSLAVGSAGYSLVAVCGLLIAVASFVEHGP